MEIDLTTMEGKVKFYYCPICGNLIEMVESSNNTPVCCGKQMKRLVPGLSDASKEKHVPQYTLKDNNLCVVVGQEPHPMTDEHSIKWIAVQTDLGVYKRFLDPGSPPKTTLVLQPGESLTAIFAYCNLHGLWMSPLVKTNTF